MRKFLKLKNMYSVTSVTKTFLSGILMLITTLSAFAQTENTAVSSADWGVFSNALFLTLLGIVILLLIIISVLGSVLKNVASYYAKHGDGKSGKWIGVMIPFLLFSMTSNAQNTTVVQTYSKIGGLTMSTFNVLLGIILLELLIITILIISINTIIRSYKIEDVVEKKAEEPSFLEKLNASVAIEKEEEIMFDHAYDGIRELDNNLPPWWKYGFYLTIIWGLVYLIHYHVTKTGDLQLGELNKELVVAEQQMEEYRKKSANLVDEKNVKMLADDASLQKGKELFTSNCAACHGKLGEGGVGPNMTDEYWLHGGSINDIFKTIKYGVVEKGMKAWETDFSPSQINQLASYIKTLVGTNPPNAKEKQGVFTEEPAAKDSSNIAIVDSTKITVMVDSVTKK